MSHQQPYNRPQPPQPYGPPPTFPQYTGGYTPPPRPISRDDREHNLALAISNAVTVERYRVESQSAGQAILVKHNPTRHGMHLGVTVLLFIVSLFLGLPLFLIPIVAWIIAAATNRRRTLILQVDRYGNVLRNAR